MEGTLANTSLERKTGSASIFPFLSLPAETRVMVYVALLSKRSTGTVITISMRNFDPAATRPKDEESLTIPSGLSVEILRVCRMIFHEAIEILYGKNDFHIVEAQVLRNFFLPKIGVHNVTLLTKVTIEIGDNDASSDLLNLFIAFQKHVPLRNIQDLTLATATSTAGERVTFTSAGFILHCLIDQEQVHRERQILTVSTLVHSGLDRTHVLERRGQRTSGGWLVSTLNLVKLSPEVRGRDCYVTSSSLLKTILASIGEGQNVTKAFEQYWIAMHWTLELPLLVVEGRNT